MTRYFLSRIQIEGFRGINNEGDPLEIKFDINAVNSIFGPNGNGKSSIFEALLYALYGTVPKLEELPAYEKAADYYCNRFHSTRTATINLTFAADDGTSATEIRVVRAKNGIRTVDSPSGCPDPEKFLRDLQCDSMLLDHNRFARFVDDTPLIRGRSFASLLGLGKLSEFRQVLQVLSNKGNLDKDLKTSIQASLASTARTNAQQALVGLRTQYKALLAVDLPEPLDPSTVGPAVSTSLTQIELIKPFFESTALPDVDFSAVVTAIKTAEQSEKREQLTATIRTISRLEGLAESEKGETAEHDLLRTEIKKRDAALALTRGQAFLHLYQAVDEILVSDDWPDKTVCPACLAEHEAPLSPVIASSLAEYQTVETAQTEIRQLWSASVWTTRFQALENDVGIAITAEQKRFAAFDRTFRTGSPTEQEFDDAIAVLKTLEEKRVNCIAASKLIKEEIEKALPPSLVELATKVEYAKQIQESLVKHDTQIKSLEAAERKRLKRESWSAFIQYAELVFSQAEVALSTATTQSLEAEYRAIYEAITSNPAVVPVLRKADGTEELFLKLESFFGLNNLSAPSLLQESYRNALALAIFLSAALRARPMSRFIVLDDVTSSFDAGHQFALMELLRTRIAYPANPGGPQIILLSHDGLLEKYFDVVSSGSDWKHQRLQGLPPCGMLTTQQQGSNRLRRAAESMLNGGQSKEAEPLIRQYLEFILLQVITRVGIPVPIDFVIRDDKKMIQNCLNAIQAAIKLHHAASSLILEKQQQTDIETVHVPQIVANRIAHYSTAVTASFTPYVYLQLLDTVDKFADCFQFDCSCNGGKQRRYYKSLSEKPCKC